MAKHREIALEIKRLIRERRLRPGDLLPSDRELAKHFRVAHTTVRYANDMLCREGLVQRRHGSGTFVAPSSRRGRQQELRHRLGLLYVDPLSRVSTYSQLLTAGIQQAANQAGFEMVIEELRSECLVQGKVPEMVRRKSVDAVLLDGAVRDHHIRFLEDHSLLYLVTGTCPLGPEVPQVRIDGERIGFEITRELLQAGRAPVWLDIDVGRTDRYHFGLELFHGYSRAVQKFGDGKHSLHLCPLHANQVTEAAAKLVQAGLKNAAILVESPESVLLPAALALKSATPEELLIAPVPNSYTCRALAEGNVMQWSRFLEVEEVGERAVRALVEVLEGRSPTLRTTSVEVRCRLTQALPVARMELACEWTAKDAFAMEQQGSGRCWREVGPDGENASPLELAGALS